MKRILFSADAHPAGGGAPHVKAARAPRKVAAAPAPVKESEAEQIIHELFRIGGSDVRAYPHGVAAVKRLGALIHGKS